MSKAKETLKCASCGMKIFDYGERGRREMQAHRAECDGINDPRDRFDVGDRVRYSEFGKLRLGVADREGEVVGFGTEWSRSQHCVRVRWDGNKTTSRYAHRFITHARGEN